KSIWLSLGPGYAGIGIRRGQRPLFAITFGGAGRQWHFNTVVTGVRSISSTIFTTHHRLARVWFEIFQLKPISMLSGNSLDDLVNVALIFWVELLSDVDSYAINSYRYDPHLLALL